MGTFIANTLQPKSMYGHDHLSNLLEVMSRICCRGSKLRQNQASNSNSPFLSQARTTSLAFPARTEEREVRGLTAREAEHWELRRTGKAENSTQAFLIPNSCSGTQLVSRQQCVYILACHWWGHFQLPFIYWATFLILPLGRSLPSSLHHCHTGYFLWFVISHTYNS